MAYLGRSTFTNITLQRILFLVFGVFLFVLLGTIRSTTVSNDNILSFQAQGIVPQPKDVEPQVKSIHPQIKSSKHPNIIFMMIDDQGYSDIGYNSRDLDKCTPHLDKLASEGIKLTNYYSLHICTPARAAFLTGLYPIHNGLYHEVIQPNQLLGLSLDYDLLPTILKEIGYETNIIGKWHLGHYALNYTPTERGFDSFYGFYTDQEYYIQHSNDHESYTLNGSEYYYYDFVLDNVLRHGDKGTLSTELFKKHAINYLENRDDETPFFLYLAWQNVHGPIEKVPAYYFTDSQLSVLENISTVNDRNLFAQLTMVLDDAIGSVVSTLQQMSYYDNTVLIVASDNGGCPYNAGYSYPFRGRKHTLYEGGSRVNSFIYSPLLSSTSKNTTYDNLFHVTDWFPTIIEGIIGRSDLIEDIDIDGVSHWSAIQGDSDEVPRTEMVYNIDPYSTSSLYSASLVNLTTPLAAIRVGNLKYITGEAYSGWFWPSGIVITDDDDDYESLLKDYSSIMTSSAVDCLRNVSENATYLFNLSSDPYEFYNLVDSEPELTAYMQAKLEEYMETMVKVSWAAEDEDAYDTWDELDYSIYPWVKL